MIYWVYFSRNCEFNSKCSKFKDSMGLPNFFFSGEGTCYCETCWSHRLRQSEEMIQVRGDPKKKFALPIGWARYPLRRRDSAEEGESWQGHPVESHDNSDGLQWDGQCCLRAV